jgi:hypothetical protein
VLEYGRDLAQGLQAAARSAAGILYHIRGIKATIKKEKESVGGYLTGRGNAVYNRDMKNNEIQRQLGILVDFLGMLFAVALIWASLFVGHAFGF